MPMRPVMKTLKAVVSRLVARGPPPDDRSPGADKPLRSELFSLDQMRRHGRALAETHRLVLSRASVDRLLPRLVENERILIETRSLLMEAAAAKTRVAPAADWLLDNFYLIEESIRASMRDLPKGYSRGLPRLRDGESAGLPRVYGLALERVSHGDGLVDPETLLDFLEAYQELAPLTLGELWAVPIMLRLALIENLRRAALRIGAALRAQNEAASWADRMNKGAETDPKSLILLVADLARSDPPLTGPFVTELARRLQGKGPALSLPLTWVEQRLSENGSTVEEFVQAEMRQQAADQVSVGNCIRGFRSLSAADWRDFVESGSAVEKALRKDPTGCYGTMDFRTRDRYRHAVESLALRSGRPEAEVASRAVALSAERFGRLGPGDPSSHVGYFLVGAGTEALRRAAGAKLSARDFLRPRSVRAAFGVYVLAQALATFLVSAALFLLAWTGGLPWWALLAAAPAVLAFAAGVASGVANWAASELAEPSSLPRLDFSAGIPLSSRTLAVVPALLTDAAHADRLLEALEVRYLANDDDNLFFGLLTDFADADSRVMDGDAELLLRAERGVARLNREYGGDRRSPFFLFHRPRLWNSRERTWMGQERKRGKIADLNALLRGGGDGAFSSVVGSREELPSVKYVIVLDTDTLLPRDAARLLAGTMAHPLNRPRWDDAADRVVEGYGILQPRVSASLVGAGISPYARLFGAEPGIDPYTRAVSDVYQDLFGEGSYIGKGIYDVDAFELALKGRFPENRILSHDLLEGCYARSGLVSDVQLFEDSPSSYAADARRRSRWIRGDWQLVAWLFPRVRDSFGQKRKNKLSLLSRWKLADNLRRSVSSSAFVVLLALGWLALAAPLAWTAVLLVLSLLPSCASTAASLMRKSPGISLRAHLGASAQAFRLLAAQSVLSLALLPYDAALSLGAAFSALWRVASSRGRLLEWNASESGRTVPAPGPLSALASMWTAPAASAAILGGLLFLDSGGLPCAAAFLVLWSASPLAAWFLSRPSDPSPGRRSPSQDLFLRSLSRRTWAFFETFAGEEDHWLPPDNFQELPVPKVAHRTSPTNIGLSLLAALTAKDLGYLSSGALLDRTGKTLDSMDALEKHRGHLFNWYDTRTLQPLPPRYVSTVDSGNLAAYLMTLRAGLAASPDDPLVGPRLWAGLADTARELASCLDHRKPPAFALFLAELEAAAADPVPGLHAAWSRLEALLRLSEELRRGEASAQVPRTKERNRSDWWMAALSRQCAEAGGELEFFAPWLPRGPFPGPDFGLSDIDGNPTLKELLALESEALRLLERNRGAEADMDARQVLADLACLLDLGFSRGQVRLTLLSGLLVRLDAQSRMDFAFLYDRKRKLLSIGYRVEARRLDAGHYDLLASEARLAAFVAVALGQIPQESWFSLGRSLAGSGREALLYSWSGSLFEYLMPLLVLPLHPETLLGRACESAVLRQIDYGRLRGVPWGISESGYNSFDAAINYQYRAFGVPGLGLKRGLADDLVVAPYATALALLVLPEKACRNLTRLHAEGFLGDYGFYEAVDYTESRVPSGRPNAVVRSFMAHHQGMSLLSYAHVLLDEPMRRRFASVPMAQATALLLEEKLPKAAPAALRAAELPELRALAEAARSSARSFSAPDTPNPETHLLSNGRYHVMVTAAGGGYSRWKDIALTRWAEDPTRDPWGSFLYVKDVQSGDLWSAAYQPTRAKGSSYEAVFSEGRAEFRRRDHDIDSYLEICVSPEDDIELRRVRFSNRSRSRRVLDLTSYAEVVLSDPAADAAHRGFGNLFVQTEALEERQVLLCSRRPRSPEESAPWLFHLMVVRDGAAVGTSFETDRLAFLGRGGSLARPAAADAEVLGGGAGPVLDPVVSVRNRLVLEADSSGIVDIVTGVAESRDGALRLAEKYRGKRFANRAFELSRTHGQVVLQHIDCTEADAQLYSRLAGSLLYANPALRADPAAIAANRRSQSGLWGYSVSGDLPIVLLRVADSANMHLVRQLLRAHSYWRLKGLAADLVIWNEEHGGYRQQLQDQIREFVAAGGAAAAGRPGGVYVCVVDQMPVEDRLLMQAAARVVLSDRLGSLEDQIDGRSVPKPAPPRPAPGRSPRNRPAALPVFRTDLLHFNGLGGFTPDGREYAVQLPEGRTTPAPWTNVIANSRFGTVVSESGTGYTWYGNAHEFRLSPWADDPVRDAGGEALYVRDEESGQFWSPSPLPCRGAGPYVARHGFGYSVFEHSEAGIASELAVYAAAEDPVKFFVLTLRNESGRARRLSATAFVELVLGDLRSRTALHVATELDPLTGALFACNRYGAENAETVVFLDGTAEGSSVSGDRREFLGRNGGAENPDALYRARLSGRVGPGLDPCAALRLPLDLADGQAAVLSFRLGAGRDAGEASSLVLRYRAVDAVRDELAAVRAKWDRLLSGIRVETPDSAFDLLVNGWLLYEVLSSRFWGRSGAYQSGGAYGFRDQLQDSLALLRADPGLVREHLLRCASRQFAEGDVQHWWHEPGGRGVRTRCSDDYLWLPLAAASYVEATGDVDVLDEMVPFLEGRRVDALEESYFDLPTRSGLPASLYDHCVRALRLSFARGVHGLPLMGSGDWNDGMNRVGLGGAGESVWLGFFSCEVMGRFSKLALRRGDSAFSDLCAQEARALGVALEAHGWDGRWYRRAYFDDGSPLGSSDNDECRIDSVSQSWAVLSGVAGPDRARTAMASVWDLLVSRELGIVRLLDPPFDQAEPDPGYIRGYLPGVRENGGQYTHAAVWTAMAFARLGEAGRAWDLFRMINPVAHSDDPAKAEIYKVEPYVMAADVYSRPPHAGRGGWTWYTGSAAWMYRLAVESLLGFVLEDGRLALAPLLPADWPGFVLICRRGTSSYRIDVRRAGLGRAGLRVDGAAALGPSIELADDGADHEVELRLSSS